MLLKGHFYILRPKDPGAFTRTEGHLHGPYQNSSNMHRKQRLPSTLNAAFYSGFLEIKQVLIIFKMGSMY